MFVVFVGTEPQFKLNGSADRILQSRAKYCDGFLGYTNREYLIWPAAQTLLGFIGGPSTQATETACWCRWIRMLDTTARASVK